MLSTCGVKRAIYITPDAITSIKRQRKTAEEADMTEKIKTALCVGKVWVVWGVVIKVGPSVWWCGRGRAWGGRRATCMRVVTHCFLKLPHKTMTIRRALLTSIICLTSSVSGFAPASSHRSFTGLHSEVTTADDATAGIQTDPKEAVKLFGRLAEKYIMLDASAGMCCYSGCTG